MTDNCQGMKALQRVVAQWGSVLNIAVIWKEVLFLVKKKVFFVVIKRVVVGWVSQVWVNFLKFSQIFFCVCGEGEGRIPFPSLLTLHQSEVWIGIVSLDYYKHALQYTGLPPTRIPTLLACNGHLVMVWWWRMAHGAGPCLTLAGGVARPKVLPRTADMCQDYLTRPLPHIEPTPLISLFS